MQRIRRIRVNPVATERLSLERTLHLVWQWLKFSGLHPNLLPISIKKRSTFDILRWLFTLILLLLSLAVCVFESFQLIIKSWSVQNMVDVVPNVFFTFPVPCIICFEYHFWVHRQQIKQFYRDWNTMERQMNCFELAKMKQDVNSLLVGILMNFIVLTILVIIWNWMEPERSFFMTHYLFIRETIGVLPTSIVTSVIFGYNAVLFFSSSTISVICFSVITCYVENLWGKWESSSKNERFLRVIWQRYESILDLVKRANELYGAIINGYIFTVIFYICIIIFYAIEEFQRNPTIFIPLLVTFAAFIHNIVSFNRSMSQLYFSKDKLQKTIADHLSLKWYKLNENDRQLLVTFLARFGKDDLCVRPMKLYCIKPSNLLSMSALIINFYIVLAQAN